MINYLHQDYLSGRRQFDAAVAYWRALCQESVTQNDQATEWKPWIGLHQDDIVAPIEEGTIFSIYSISQSKAINIEQYAPKEPRVEISAMLDTFGDGQLEIPIKVLTLCCSLSEQSAHIARELINVWVRSATTMPDMEATIEQFNLR